MSLTWLREDGKVTAQCLQPPQEHQAPKERIMSSWALESITTIRYNCVQENSWWVEKKNTSILCIFSWQNKCQGKRWNTTCAVKPLWTKHRLSTHDKNPFFSRGGRKHDLLLPFTLPAQQTKPPCTLIPTHYNCIADIHQNQPSFRTNSLCG